MPEGFRARLLKWYHANRRDLPWRRSRDPYRVWVSEMMLQQTTVNTVASRYDGWFQRFPTVASLASAPLEEVLKAWQGLGYYARARNLHRAAQIVQGLHQGRLPQNPDIVRALPGFGPYATAAVLSIAYDVPLVVIDANVRRVIMRVLALAGFADSRQDRAINAFLRDVFSSTMPGDFNQALMELGALVCKPKIPCCGQCPLQFCCRAYQARRQEEIPASKIKILTAVHAAVGIIRKENCFFLQRRTANGLLQGLWEFPGGKIEKNESAAQALRRELREELGVKVTRSTFLFEVMHFYTRFKVRLSVFECRVKPLPEIKEGRCWAMDEDIKRLPLPSGTRKIFDRMGL